MVCELYFNKAVYKKKKTIRCPYYLSHPGICFLDQRTPDIVQDGATILKLEILGDILLTDVGTCITSSLNQLLVYWQPGLGFPSK